MPEDCLNIRPMQREEVDIAVNWAEAEGWNPGIHDAECFHAMDAEGFLIGLLNNEPVAMVSAVRYSDSYGFMGFYIVKPEFRNRNYAIGLWEEGLRYLGNRGIGLDSVRPDLVSRQKPEFKPAYMNYRFKWVKKGHVAVIPETIELARIPFSVLEAYDREMFGYSREPFLKCWISRPGTYALASMNGDKLSGYGVLRKCREGFKIGPLFADTEDVAKGLFQALTRYVKKDEHVYFDTPERNPDAVKMAQSYGMTEVFRTTRMYRGQEPDVPLAKWFGITSFELG